MNFELKNIVINAEKIFDVKTLYDRLSDNGFRGFGFLILENKECHIKFGNGHSRCIYVETGFPKRDGFNLFNIIPRLPPIINNRNVPRQFIESMFTIIYSHGIIETFEYRRIYGEKLMLDWAEKRKDVDGKNSLQFFNELISYKSNSKPIIVPKKFDRAFFHGREIDFTFFKNFDHELRFNVEENDLHLFRQYNSPGKTLYSENLRCKNIKYLSEQDYDEKITFRNIQVILFDVGDNKRYIGKSSIVEIARPTVMSVNNIIVFRGKNIFETVSISCAHRENINEEWIEFDGKDVYQYIYKLLVE
jgi:hypothetical protein